VPASQRNSGRLIIRRFAQPTSAHVPNEIHLEPHGGLPHRATDSNSTAAVLVPAPRRPVIASPAVAADEVDLPDAGVGPVFLASGPHPAEASSPRPVEAFGPRPVEAFGPHPVEAFGPHPVELAGLLHELSAHLLSADDLPQALGRLAAFAAGAIPGVPHCSVMLIGENAPLTIAVSGPVAQAFEDLQCEIGHGPGLDAARTRAVVTVPDLTSDARWPELADCARAEGIRSVAAIPIDVQRATVGSLSIYLPRPDDIGPDLLLTAMALVSQAEVLLGELRRRDFLSAGAVVDRAAGVIIAQRGCSVQEAYDVLQDTAHRLGMDRRAVAERLIAAAARNA